MILCVYAEQDKWYSQKYLVVNWNKTSDVMFDRESI